MRWQRVVLLALAGFAGGLLDALLEYGWTGHVRFAGIAFALTAVALRLFWRRCDAEKAGAGRAAK